MNDLEIAGKFAGLHGLDKDMLDTTHISRDALRDWVLDVVWCDLPNVVPDHVRELGEAVDFKALV